MALTYMTREGYKKKMEEIAYLESVERPRISAAIAEARDKGDLSENSEYDAAKEAQGMLEMKIAKLKDLVANARIIDESKLNTDEVNILACENQEQGQRHERGIHNRGRFRSQPAREENRRFDSYCQGAARAPSG